MLAVRIIQMNLPRYQWRPGLRNTESAVGANAAPSINNERAF